MGVRVSALPTVHAKRNPYISFPFPHRTCRPLSARKGGRPKSSMERMQPTDHMSEAALASAPKRTYLFVC